jgi:hypothetical protein
MLVPSGVERQAMLLCSTLQTRKKTHCYLDVMRLPDVSRNLATNLQQNLTKKAVDNTE